MFKKVMISGLLGGMVFILWTFIVNAVFGFKNTVDMKTVPNETQVYDILIDNIKEPGRYICNPPLTEHGFPENEPVFGILYGGMGHEAAGWLMLVQLPLFFLIPLVGSWMLSVTSEKMIGSYYRKVLFFAGIGLLIALFSNLMNFGIANYPLRDAVILAIHNLVLWTAIGLVVAWQMKPAQSK